MVLDGESSQEYPVNAGVPQGFILGLTFFRLYINEILLSMLMILLFTLSVIMHLICGSNYNWLLNINLIYKTLWTDTGSDLLISMLENATGFV